MKYSKITGLADDLCLAMQAESVLIDRIPGKSTVGIQIPNPNREQISLRELLESDAYRRSQSKLTLALGKTIHGEPFVSDLATMPHLLIAGSTGTGKSVSVNAMLSSILFRATPDDVRLIMVDPKRLELGMYEDIPHLLTPVVVDPKLAANALRWAVREMEERYKTLAAVGVRNIEQYNRNLKLAQAENNGPVLDDNGIEVKPLPFIVVLIDELADLMMVAGNEVEESIARLAQMARAVGIHLILATQRPSVDVITGLIKANLPARISFRVSSKIDSRTILDGNGAEQLLGKGDMLYLPPASSRFVRLHGPYISEQESARLASFLRKQGKPTYDETITADEKQAGGDLEFEKDDLYDEAARIVVSSGQASISVSAAPAAHRLQPRRAARRHDGGRGLVSRRGRRQGARGAGEEGLLRRRTRSALTFEVTYAMNMRIKRSRPRRCWRCSPRAPAAARSPRTPRIDLRARSARERESARRDERRDAPTARGRRRPTSVVRRYPSERLLRQRAVAGRRTSRCWLRAFRQGRGSATAVRLLKQLRDGYPSSLVRARATAARRRRATPAGRAAGLARAAPPPRLPAGRSLSSETVSGSRPPPPPARRSATIARRSSGRRCPMAFA